MLRVASYAIGSFTRKPDRGWKPLPQTIKARYPHLMIRIDQIGHIQYVGGEKISGFGVIHKLNRTGYPIDLEKDRPLPLYVA